MLHWEHPYCYLLAKEDFTDNNGYKWRGFLFYRQTLPYLRFQVVGVSASQKFTLQIHTRDLAIVTLRACQIHLGIFDDVVPLRLKGPDVGMEGHLGHYVGAIARLLESANHKSIVQEAGWTTTFCVQAQAALGNH